MEHGRVGRCWLAGAVVLSLMIAAVAPADAHVLVRPARIEAQVENGTQLPPIQVTNRGETPVRVVAYTGVGGHDLQGRLVVQDDGAARPESDGYLRLLEHELYIEPGDTVPLLATVHLPDGFTGGLYPVIFLEVHPAQARRGGGVQAVGRVAVLTLLTAGDGEALVHGEGALVRSGPGAGAVEVAVRVRNEGNVHAVASGTVTIADGDGAPVARIPLAPGIVLPGFARELSAHWLPPATAEGPFVATVHLEEAAGPSPLQVVFELVPAPALADAGGSGQ